MKLTSNNASYTVLCHAFQILVAYVSESANEEDQRPIQIINILASPDSEILLGL